MPKYTRREFYELCGVSKPYLAQYIKRGKVILGEDNLIDSNILQNRDFAESRTGGNRPTPTQPKGKGTKNATVKVTPKPSNKVQPMVEHSQEASEANGRYNLDLQIKTLEIEKKEQEVELNKIKIAKARGEVIPTGLVRVLFSQHSKSITVSFHQGADNFITTIAKMTGMSREDMAMMKGELIEIVNEAVRDSLETSQSSVNNIVSEYSEKRGVGEKK